MRNIKYRYLYNGEWCYIDFQKDNLGEAFALYESRAKTSRLAQSSEIQDQDGKEIYEGDIIEHWHTYDKEPDKTVYRVLWNTARFLMHRTFEDNQELEPCGKYHTHRVIGNMLQSPELMEEQE